MNLDKAVFIKSFTEEPAAQLAAAELEADGIETQIRNDGLLQVYAFPLTRPGGFQLFVEDVNVERAREILGITEEQALETHEPPVKEELEVSNAKEEKSAKRPNYFWAGLLVGLTAGCIAFAVHYQHEHRPFNGKRYIEGDSYTWGFYENGRLVRVEKDRNYDGKVDEREYHEKNQVHIEFDENFNGVVDSWWTYKNGVVTENKQDVDFDGKPDVVSKYEHGVIKESLWYAKEKNTVWKKNVFARDNTSEEWIDEDGDGKFDVKTEFDAFQRLIKTTKLNSPKDK